jgi:hypothetical protein
MYTMRVAVTTMIAVPLLCATLVGQSATPSTRHQTFHVHGSVRNCVDFVLAGALVEFQGKGSGKTVAVDDEGFYTAELPVGPYTMKVHFPGGSLQDYQRPLFRVTSPTSLTLNVTLNPAKPSCELMGTVSRPDLTVDDYRNACGDEEFFPAPSEDGLPFQLYIRYPRRQPTDQGYIYRSGRIVSDLDASVFVAYNLFTLQADQVAYDAKRRTLEASGNVVVVNETGVSQHADSVTFKIENGQAIQLR